MVSSVYSMGLNGVEAFLVTAEVDISRGLPAFEIVGLPDASVKESKDRVRAALKNSEFKFPVSRIIVNLAPGNIKKYGPIYDLPILLAVLSASGQIDFDNNDSIFIGELSLSGELKHTNGILPMAIKAKELGLKKIYLPKANAKEAAIIDGIEIFPVNNVLELKNHINYEKRINIQPRTEIIFKNNNSLLDFSQIKGQYDAKRAVEIAAAGNHNILLIGPPGSGKSMLAKRMPTIMPSMNFEEIIETTKIYSILGMLSQENPLVLKRPFRSPHHTVSPAGLTGGGSIPKPGELSLAHNGILFLDELPEFSRDSLEVLRQPIEEGKITISRVKSSFTYPCSVLLIVAMNPCPCGYYGHPNKICTCSKRTINKYLSRVSGPLLDRIDLHIEVPSVEFESISSYEESEKSELILKRVILSRNLQNQRYKSKKICNSKADLLKFKEYFEISPNSKKILQKAFEKMGISARGYEKILRISRSIADLENSEKILEEHILEAIQYRSLDKKYWYH
ncbi:MAG: YifB family Mg chelatase-like AAA ATPase [Clostridia bacterium]|nr:YifB family Mg chelatase-like AAA ATPase [Clostridia bacterium]